MSKAKRYGHRYPWRAWFDLGTVHLIREQDYHGRSDTMAQTIRLAGRRLGYEVSVKLADDGQSLTLTATKEEPKHASAG